jgi:hypothetical protein
VQRTVGFQASDIYASVNFHVTMKAKNVFSAVLLFYSLLSAVKSFFSFRKRPLPVWFDWLDTIFICMVIFPVQRQPRRIALWILFTAVYVSAKVVGMQGHKLVAGSMLSVLGVCSAGYSFYLFKRPIEVPVKPMDEEKEVLLGTKAEEQDAIISSPTS